ncbi:response regulator [Microbacterium sp. P05]|uniref:response regulator transcription factor n=1 Tax=Microbacterium sp. P05 TaxID=3366948 RepID=UPI003746A5F6
MTASDIRVLIADDNRAVRHGLRVQLAQADGISVIGEVTNGTDAVAIARAERADVVLMDLQMPGVDGIEATRLLAGPQVVDRVSVIVLTSHSGDRYVLDAIEAGASGYLLKGHDSAQLIEAITATARGDAHVSPRVAAHVLRELSRRVPSVSDARVVQSLTPAERNVVARLSRGTTANDEIAAELHVSVNTVRSQVRSALRKVGVEDRTQLALWGARNHLDR